MWFKCIILLVWGTKLVEVDYIICSSIIIVLFFLKLSFSMFLIGFLGGFKGFLEILMNFKKLLKELDFLKEELCFLIKYLICFKKFLKENLKGFWVVCLLNALKKCF